MLSIVLAASLAIPVTVVPPHGAEIVSRAPASTAPLQCWPAGGHHHAGSDPLRPLIGRQVGVNISGSTARVSGPLLKVTPSHLHIRWTYNKNQLVIVRRAQITFVEVRDEAWPD